jgi:hypothetical protein
MQWAKINMQEANKKICDEKWLSERETKDNQKLFIITKLTEQIIRNKAIKKF